MDPFTRLSTMHPLYTNVCYFLFIANKYVCFTPFLSFLKFFPLRFPTTPLVFLFSLFIFGFPKSLRLSFPTNLIVSVLCATVSTVLPNHVLFVHSRVFLYGHASRASPIFNFRSFYSAFNTPLDRYASFTSIIINKNYIVYALYSIIII